jgi:hypothetical protein
MDRACILHERDDNSLKILVGKSEKKRPSRRPRHRWEDNIRIGWKVVDWIHLAQDWGQ